MMRSSDKGFTLMELLLSAAILTFCLCGLMLTYINMFLLADLTRDLTQATNLIQFKIEEARQTNFTALASFSLDYDEDLNFQTDAAYNAARKKGVVVGQLSNTVYGDLRQMRIFSCFRSHNRIIGDDINNCTNSPVEAITLIADAQ